MHAGVPPRNSCAVGVGSAVGRVVENIAGAKLREYEHVQRAECSNKRVDEEVAGSPLSKRDSRRRSVNAVSDPWCRTGGRQPGASPTARDSQGNSTTGWS